MKKFAMASSAIFLACKAAHATGQFGEMEETDYYSFPGVAEGAFIWENDLGGGLTLVAFIEPVPNKATLTLHWDIYSEECDPIASVTCNMETGELVEG